MGGSRQSLEIISTKTHWVQKDQLQHLSLSTYNYFCICKIAIHLLCSLGRAGMWDAVLGSLATALPSA